VNNDESISIVTPDQRLFRADSQVAVLKQTFMKLFQYFILKCLIEIDHDVATKNKIKLVEYLSQYKIVFAKSHVHQQFFVKDGVSVFLFIITLKGVCSLKADVILLVELHVFDREGGGLCPLENINIKVCCEDGHIV